MRAGKSGKPSAALVGEVEVDFRAIGVGAPAYASSAERKSWPATAELREIR